MLQGQIVRFFQLTEDFRFSEDHGIEPAGDLEQMMNALRLSHRVDFVCKWIAIIVATDQEFL